jgi:hypothetical protein
MGHTSRSSVVGSAEGADNTLPIIMATMSRRPEMLVLSGLWVSGQVGGRTNLLHVVPVRKLALAIRAVEVVVDLVFFAILVIIKVTVTHLALELWRVVSCGLAVLLSGVPSGRELPLASSTKEDHLDGTDST